MVREPVEQRLESAERQFERLPVTAAAAPEVLNKISELIQASELRSSAHLERDSQER